jgi:DNA-binding response OmpR family regulator
MSNLHSPRILIADDQESLRKLLVKYMLKAGFEPIEAENGKRAIELYRLMRPSVVLSDIMMPEMDGLTLLKEIKKIDKQAAVILMTGYGSEEVLIESLRGGATNYFKKPFNFQEVTEVIKHILKYRADLDSAQYYSPFITEENKKFVFTTEEADIFPIINQVTINLARLVPTAEILTLKIGMEEILKNAIEHGNLNISAEEKNHALEEGVFGKLINSRLQQNCNGRKKIFITAKLDQEAFSVTIRDQGEGFDWKSLPQPSGESLLNFSGRGILLTRIYFDEVLYNEHGNEVTLVKRVSL